MKYILTFLFCFNLSYSNNDSIYRFQNSSIFPSYIKDNSFKSSFRDPSKNLIKLSFPIFNLPAISLQYERNIYKKITAGVALSYVSEQEFLILKLYTQQKISNDFSKHQLSNIKTSITSVSPEVKIYFGKDVFKGFYLSPFVRFAKYDVEFPLQFVEDNLDKYYQHVTFSGKFNSFTYGLSIGAQWEIYKNFYLDWLIVGPHFGNSTEHLILESDLSFMQQKGIRKSLDIIQTSIRMTDELPDIEFDYEVNENGGTVTIKNPWAGMRLQLGIGYRF